MLRSGFALFTTVISLFSPATLQAKDTVDFSIVDRIQFSVPGEWPVLRSDSTSEKTVFVFQIPNDADKKTADSSNLVLVVTQLKTAQEQSSFLNEIPGVANGAHEKALVDDWHCSTFSAVQGSTKTEYVIWDCHRMVVDSGVAVRIAWPHLRKNPSDYDSQMETILTEFLTAVSPYKDIPKSGVLRRQAGSPQ